MRAFMWMPWLVACGVEMEPVSLHFEGRVAEESFTCGETYRALGTAASDWKASDLRFYVHDIRLVDDANDEVPLELDQDGTWQHEGLALVDLEDGADSCEAGTPARHEDVTGTIEGGHTWTGLRFKLGVPADLNHLDPTAAPPPLDVSSMFWVWLSGHKFLRVDGATVTEGDALSWLVHLGSTGCAGDNPTAAPTAPCDHPNVGEVAIDGFNPTTTSIVADLATLFANADLSANTGDPGCMGNVDDPECAAILPALGVALDGAPAAQSFFHLF